MIGRNPEKAYTYGCLHPHVDACQVRVLTRNKASTYGCLSSPGLDNEKSLQIRMPEKAYTSGCMYLHVDAFIHIRMLFDLDKKHPHLDAKKHIHVDACIYIWMQASTYRCIDLPVNHWLCGVLQLQCFRKGE